MKNSIAYLHKNNQNDLNFLVSEIRKRLPQTEVIILYGSYARDNYVRRDIIVEHGDRPKATRVKRATVTQRPKGFLSERSEFKAFQRSEGQRVARCLQP